MADTAISALAAYTTVHSDDLLVVVDVHDTSMAPSGTNKKATVSQIGAMIGAGGVTYAMIQNTAASRLLGNPTGSAVAPSEIAIGGGLRFNSTTLNAPSAKFSFGVNGTPSVSDVTPPVFVDRAIVADGLTMACGTAPSGGAFAAKIQTSTNGSSWSDLASGAVSISSGGFSATAACTTSIPANTYLRLNFTAVNSGANAGVLLFYKS